MGTTTRLTSGVIAPLLERDDALVVLHSSLSEVRSGVGRMLLVSGEAGIGKTALVRSFVASVRGRPACSGGVRRTVAPTPAGRLRRHRRRLGDRLRELVAQGAPPHEVFEAVSDELAGRRPCWWSRTCTGRTRRPSTCCASSAGGSRASTRSSSSPTATTAVGAHRCACCSVISPPRRGRARVALEPLSPAGRRRAGRRPRSTRPRLPADRRQPVLRHEVLEAGGDRVPATVGEVVYTRAARLSEDARTVLDGVACGTAGARAPGRSRRSAARPRAALDECLAAACWSRGRPNALPARARPAAVETSSGRPAGASCTARCWPR